MTPIAANIANHVSPKMSVQKRVRHRRVGSAGNGNQLIAYSQIPKSSPIRDRRSQSEPMEQRKIKLIDTETQTDLMDISADCTPSPCLASHDISSCLEQSSSILSTVILTRRSSERNYCETEQHETNEMNQNNGNADAVDTTDAVETGEAVMTNSDLTYHDACSSPDEQMISDAMNSNERLDIRECSDDDNLEQITRRFTKFMNRNRLSVQSENGNSTTNGEGSTFFDVTNARRSIISVNGDEVTIISRNYANGNSKAMNNYSDSKQQMINNLSDDQDYDDEGDDDSWTDEDRDDTDNNFSLRRKR